MMRLGDHPIGSAAVASVWEKERSKLLERARRLGVRAGDVEDVVQNTFFLVRALEPRDEIAEILAALEEIKCRLHSGLTALTVVYLRYSCRSYWRRPDREIPTDMTTVAQPVAPLVDPAAQLILDGIDEHPEQSAHRIADACGMDPDERAYLIYKLTTEGLDKDFGQEPNSVKTSRLKARVLVKVKRFLSGEPARPAPQGRQR